MPTVTRKIVAFADIQGYHRQICSELSAAEVFEFLSRYYCTAQRTLEGSNGRIVKFIGDSILFVLPAEAPSEAIETLRKVKFAVESFLMQEGYGLQLRIKAHVGEVATGMIGVGELERFDVCGTTVNETALLPDGEWVLSDNLQNS